MDEWWLWFQGPFAGKIWEHTWNNDQLKDEYDRGVLLAEAYVIGSVRVRQVRSQEYLKTDHGRTFRAWHPYSSDTEMTSNSLLYGDYTTQGLSELNGMSYDSFSTLDYGVGGYSFEFPRSNATASLSLMRALKEKRWLDGGTRVIAVDLNVYNPSTDVITALRVTTEFLSSGLILKQGWAFSARVTLYSTKMVDIVRGVMELIVVFFVIFYWYCEIREIWKAGGFCSFRFTLFDVLSQLNLLLIALAIVIHLWFSYNFLIDMQFDTDDYIDLYTSLEWWAVKKNLVGSTLLFGYIRLFRYLELNARIKVLIYALMNSMEDLITTFFVLVTCIGGFAVCGMLLFGENLQEFSAIGYSFSTLLRALISDFDCYEELRYFHPSLAPMYYAAYTFVVLLVVFNMLIAVIIDGYEEAKNIILHQKVDNDRAPFVQSRTMHFFKFIWFRSKGFFLGNCSGRRKKQTIQKQKEQNRTGNNARVEPAFSTARDTIDRGTNQQNLFTKEDDAPNGGASDAIMMGGEAGDQVRRSSNMDSSEVLQRLANKKSNPQNSTIRLEHLVQHVKRANDTLKPAHELKSLFQGNVEEKFKKM